MSDRLFSDETFMLIYCLVRCKIQKMCDEAVDGFLAASKFIPDRFVTSKMLESFHDTLFSNFDVLVFDQGFIKVACFSNEMDILIVDLDKVNLDDGKKLL